MMQAFGIGCSFFSQPGLDFCSDQSGKYPAQILWYMACPTTCSPPAGGSSATDGKAASTASIMKGVEAFKKLAGEFVLSYGI